MNGKTAVNGTLTQRSHEKADDRAPITSMPTSPGPTLLSATRSANSSSRPSQLALCSSLSILHSSLSIRYSSLVIHLYICHSALSPLLDWCNPAILRQQLALSPLWRFFLSFPQPYSYSATSQREIKNKEKKESEGIDFDTKRRHEFADPPPPLLWH